MPPQDVAGNPRLARRALHERLLPVGRTGDILFRLLMGALALVILAMAGIILWKLVDGARPILSQGLWEFVSSRVWDPVEDPELGKSAAFGALPFITGTLLTSAMALALALPIGIGIAVLLAEYSPEWLRNPLSFLVELLAAIPSIVYGLWGIFVLAPAMRDHVNPFLEKSPLGLLPMFGEPAAGRSMLTASVILAIMCIPIIAAISREVMLAVPRAQREAALALGCTRWEAIRYAVITYGRAGILGAALIGLGRALGETMAVTMVIGNRVQVTGDFFDPAYTMSAVIANEFTETSSPLHTPALVSIGLVLFVMSFLVNVLARFLVSRLKHAGGSE